MTAREMMTADPAVQRLLQDAWKAGANLMETKAEARALQLRSLALMTELQNLKKEVLDIIERKTGEPAPDWVLSGDFPFE